MQGFYRAFLAAAGVEAAGILQDIIYRYLLASLYGSYQDTERLLAEDGTEPLAARSRGIGNASVVKIRLFQALHPSVDPASKRASCRKLWR